MPSSHNSILALDVGQARIGVALASNAARIAAPLSTLPNDTGFTSKLVQLIASHSVDTLVVGLPRGLGGQNTPQTEYVLAFAKNLQNVTKLSVVLQDEALTSVNAEKELKARGKAYTREDVDALSATYILEDYLQGGST